MSALHEAVARAIASASRPWMPYPSGFADAAAAAAVRVVLAEATRSIEALPTHTRIAAHNPGWPRVAVVDLAVALAVLAALGDEA